MHLKNKTGIQTYWYNRSTPQMAFLIYYVYIRTRIGGSSCSSGQSRLNLSTAHSASAVDGSDGRFGTQQQPFSGADSLRRLARLSKIAWTRSLTPQPPNPQIQLAITNSFSDNRMSSSSAPVSHTACKKQYLHVSPHCQAMSCCACN